MRPATALGRLGLFGSVVELDRFIFDVVVMYYTYASAAHGSAAHIWPRDRSLTCKSRHSTAPSRAP
eukprot:8190535-Pyramimonas_sp.AAC.1